MAFNMMWNPKPQWNPEVQAYLSKVFGEDKFMQMQQALCTPPLRVTCRVNLCKTNVKSVVDDLANHLSEEDRDMLLQSGVKPIQHELLREVVQVAGSGPHKICYTSGIKEVVVGRLAGEAILRGSQLFVPGVLSASRGLEAGDDVAISVALETQDGGYATTRHSTLEDLNDEELSQLSRQGLYIGIGTSKMSRAQMMREKSGIAVLMKNRVFQIPGCNGVLPGQIMVQNLPSIVAAAVVDPQPGDRVLDMCAAPGGKSTGMAQRMGDKGNVIAIDRSHKKVQGIQEIANEFGLTSIKPIKLDSLKLLKLDQQMLRRGLEGGDSHDWKRKERKRARAELVRQQYKPKNAEVEKQLLDSGLNLEQFGQGSFDCVLLDPPCSSLGLRPRLYHPQTLKELCKNAAYQKHFVDIAVHMVKEGGTLVYSTCTINPDENEVMVRYILDNYKQFQLVEAAPRIGGPGLTGKITICDGEGRTFERNMLTEDEAKLVQRFDPSSDIDTIGFFISKFKKLK